MGLYPATGKLSKDGREVPLGRPEAALAAGMAFLSEDRRGVGLLLDESIMLNIAVTAHLAKGRFRRRAGLGLFTVIDEQSVWEHAMEQIERLDIRCTGPDQPVRRLSGGNQQKVCIARAITLEPDFLFVSEPTRGVDVGAKKRILDTLVALNREGLTIVMTSSELAEIRMICDRIAIVARGRVNAILSPDDTDERFGLAMAGAA
jgi:simple sugar transport system ATP-binding protein